VVGVLRQQNELGALGNRVYATRPVNAPPPGESTPVRAEHSLGPESGAMAMSTFVLAISKELIVPAERECAAAVRARGHVTHFCTVRPENSAA
jgi:hypothetical protein